jgi:hypothetical protein
MIFNGEMQIGKRSMTNKVLTPPLLPLLIPLPLPVAMSAGHCDGSRGKIAWKDCVMPHPHPSMKIM